MPRDTPNKSVNSARLSVAAGTLLATTAHGARMEDVMDIPSAAAQQDAGYSAGNQVGSRVEITGSDLQQRQGVGSDVRHTSNDRLDSPLRSERSLPRWRF